MPFKTQPPTSPSFTLSFPHPHILLVTITRPTRLNALPLQAHKDGHAIWTWFDNEPSLRVGIITGEGTRAFSAGADLKEQFELRASPNSNSSNNDANSAKEKEKETTMPGGFGGLSQRRGKKPVIAAVNGLAFGGGFEICLNCDIIISSPEAQFSLPEVRRGLYAGAGGISRLVRTVGVHIASELILTGRRISALEARDLRLVNRVSETAGDVLRDAVEMAKAVLAVSPDAVIVSRFGVREAVERGVGDADEVVREVYGQRLMEGENLRRGLAAFVGGGKGGKGRGEGEGEVEWVDSKL